ncbi:MAG: 23S rRNA (pseudouridine(1915)-N(3))-methyltransferase RlmH [Erysipelotrichaceae bacterium]|jgi:23S rRNA (pseudouridine1915-N3)-methyltransferase|nr:23S rRNA (pseudouridine(1915)-N(3))-methyltransferase RlmH [Erysipelotrichaceae bacterium]
MIKLICVGKLKEKALVSLVEDYSQRIQPFHKLSLIELPDEPNTESESLNLKAIDKESKAILSTIGSDDGVILLDLKGVLISSEKLALLIQTNFNRSVKNVVFVIGGSLGVNDELRERADFIWKLSDNTFPHGLVRVLVLEQIYRSFKILSNQTYHK